MCTCLIRLAHLEVLLQGGIAVVQNSTIEDRIIQAVTQTPGCLIEELMLACPDLTWNEVFLAVDHLSRTGRVRLTSARRGHYTVALPPRALGNGSGVCERLAQGS